MNIFLCLLISLATPAAASMQTARTDGASDAAVHVVSYFEIAPASERAVMGLLREYRDASRKEEGHLRLEVMQQSDRPDHFAILEVWKDQKSFEAHGTAAHTKQFRDKLQPLRVSPYDERAHGALMMGSTAGPKGATYVLTHADAAGGAPVRDEAIALLKQLAENSRKDDGNLGFEVLQQSSRQNHATIVEMWRDQQAFDRHRLAAHTKQFREKFQPLSGALYDERVYKSFE